MEAGGINDWEMLRIGHKTKGCIPAIAGTENPVGVGDQPGRLGDGRKRIRREATTSDANQ